MNQSAACSKFDKKQQCTAKENSACAWLKPGKKKGKCVLNKALSQHARVLSSGKSKKQRALSQQVSGESAALSQSSSSEEEDVPFVCSDHHNDKEACFSGRCYWAEVVGGTRPTECWSLGPCSQVSGAAKCVAEEYGRFCELNAATQECQDKPDAAAESPE
jgi:hypothetical protein